MPEDHRRQPGLPGIVRIGLVIGLLAGVIFLGVVEVLSRGWNSASTYNQNLGGIGITQTFVSLMLVLFLAGLFAAYVVPADTRVTRILTAALAGAVAAIIARTLLFIPDPIYLVNSLISTWPLVLLLVGGAALVALFGGLVASFLKRDQSEGYGNLLPIVLVAVALIALPPLLAMAGIATGMIPPAPYSGGAPAPETDIIMLKVSATGDVEWETRVDISAYDQPDALAECGDGYALVIVEPGQEKNTMHILLYDERGNARDQSAVDTGFGRVTALVPALNGGFMIASETPEIICVDASGETLWKHSLVNESRAMASVSLLALPDHQYIAVWEDQVTCFSANGTWLWQTPLGAVGGGWYHPVYPVQEEGMLVFSEGRNVFAGDHFETYIQAIRLDSNGTILWKRDFGSEGLDELLGAWEIAPERFSVLYRSTTFPKELWGSVVPAYQGYFFTLGENGDVTEFHAVEDDGGVVIQSSGGYLSIVTGDAVTTLVGLDTAGNEIWRQEWAMNIDRYSIRGIGTLDGGYLIAGSTAA
jgi:outer membrane protein assembly factor BamB